MILSFICVLFGYLIGSIPFGLVVAHFSGHGDIRKFGSGNIGTTNAVRKMGKMLGGLVFILDALKGILAVYTAKLATNDYSVEIYSGLAAVLGHIFPIWLGFRGGKGVATMLAVLCALNIYVGIAACLVWLAVFLLYKISGLSAVAAFISAPIITNIITHDPRLLYPVTLISALILIKHKENIRKFIKERSK